MTVIEISSNLEKTVAARLAVKDDFRVLTKKRYSFNWKALQKTASIYVLCIEGEDDILGAVALELIDSDRRIEIKLLASARENIGANKLYSGIAGCLIAFACRLALVKFGIEACVSLVPKTELKEHYMHKYYMLNAGWQLYLDGKQLQKILKEYFG